MNVPAKPAPLPRWETCAYNLWRVPVPGGWIYRTTDDSTQSPALVFVPHPPVEDISPVHGGGPA